MHSESNWNPRLRQLSARLPGIIGKLIVAFIFVFPFYWMVITSFKPYIETIQFPPTLWPQNFTLDAYRSILGKMNLMGYVKNSIIVSVSEILLQLVVMIPAAYAFARYNFVGKGIMFGMVLVALMIPVQVTFITVYLLMAKWKLLGTLLPQIIPFGTNAFGIFLLRQSFLQIPEEVIESAKLDNASELQIMTQIMLPMVKPTVITISMFSFIGRWNAYFWPLVMTDVERIRPLTIAIEKLKDVEYGINWNILMAGNVLLVAPILVVFFFASRKIMEAFAYRGVK